MSTSAPRPIVGARLTTLALSATLAATSWAAPRRPTRAALGHDAGASRGTATEASARRVYSRSFFAFIVDAPRAGARRLGYFRPGEALLVRPDASPRPGTGCSEAYVPVQPRGWVCQGKKVTTEETDRAVQSFQALTARSGPFPYHYALSDGAPMYRRLPTAGEVRRAETRHGPAGVSRPLPYWERGHEILAERPDRWSAGQLPFFLRQGGSARRARPLGLVRKHIPHGSMLAFTRVVEHDGRSYALSADGTVVPTARLRRFRRSDFHGVVLSASGASLPLGWRVRTAGKSYRLERGRLVDPRPVPLRSWVAIESSAPIQVAGQEVLRIRGTSRVVPTDGLTIVRRSSRPVSVKEGDRWLDVSVGAGTLVAYDGDVPVFATLVSPGRGGAGAVDAAGGGITPLGIFRVRYKHRVATMARGFGASRTSWIADVPDVQYFHAPIALHTAYWHDRFGQPMSGGCLNVSPRDGRHLFTFTSPHLPPGWSGVAADRRHRGTKIRLRR